MQKIEISCQQMYDLLKQNFFLSNDRLPYLLRPLLITVNIILFSLSDLRKSTIEDILMLWLISRKKNILLFECLKVNRHFARWHHADTSSPTKRPNLVSHIFSSLSVFNGSVHLLSPSLSLSLSHEYKIVHMCAISRCDVKQSVKTLKFIDKSLNANKWWNIELINMALNFKHGC